MPVHMRRNPAVASVMLEMGYVHFVNTRRVINL
jgi:hypothetical protein